MRWWRRAAQAVADVLFPQPLTMQERMQRDEALKRAWMAQQPSVDDTQRQAAAEAAMRAEVAADRASQSLVWTRTAGFSGEDPSPVPAVYIPAAAWSGPPSEAAPAPGRPMTEYEEDMSSPNPARWLKWQSLDERLGPPGGRWRP